MVAAACCSARLPVPTGRPTEPPAALAAPAAVFRRAWPTFKGRLMRVQASGRTRVADKGVKAARVLIQEGSHVIHLAVDDQPAIFV